MNVRVIFAALLAVLTSLPAHAAITKQAWGGVGKKGVDLYILTNIRGMEVKISNYGGIITSIRVPDRTGKLENVNLGFDQLENYRSPGYSGRYGALIGRYANRIKNNAFKLGGVFGPARHGRDFVRSDSVVGGSRCGHKDKRKRER